ncbi:hypothetical protein IJI02_00150 [Candidatus Saccharibacteria bacterium]|nr:hypothetical protein [Candidatus Saccharibacteria bacterium]
MLAYLSEIFLSALILSSLQLDLGGFLVLYHSTKAKFFSRKTRALATSYILGSLTMFFLLLSVGLFLYTFIPPLYLIIALVVVALAAWLLYYRKGRSTELWLPRPISRFLHARAEATSSSIEAFSLGLLTPLAELPFVLLPSLVAAQALLSLDNNLLVLGFTLLYLFIAILPLLVCRLFLRRGSSLVDVQRWRVRNRLFFRIFAGVLYLVLAFFLCCFVLWGTC